MYEIWSRRVPYDGTFYLLCSIYLLPSSFHSIPFPIYLDREPLEAAFAVVNEGLRLQPTENTPPQIAQMMESCFASEPSKRPPFSDLFKWCMELEDTLKKS